MEFITLIKDPAVWLLTGLMSMFWSVLASFITPRIKLLLKKRIKPKLQKDIEKAQDLKYQVQELEHSPTRRVEQKLNCIQKYLLSTTYILISFIFMWLSTFAVPFWALVIAAIFLFYLGISISDKAAKEFYVAKLAEQRSTELNKFKTDLNKSLKFYEKTSDEFTKQNAKVKNEYEYKIKQINLRDFNIE